MSDVGDIKDCDIRECDMYPQGYFEIIEDDFYPPEDNRVLVCGIDDIEGGDTYSDYLEYFWDNYENCLYD